MIHDQLRYLDYIIHGRGFLRWIFYTHIVVKRLPEGMKKSLIIFDMDGVLVDVSRSYREVSRLTVVEYLRRIFGAHVSDGFITLVDVAEVKKSGGLNNDWDLTDAILNAYLLNAFPSLERDLTNKLSGIAAAEDDGALLEQTGLADFSAYAPILERLVNEKSAPSLFSADGWSRGRRSPLHLNRGDVGSGNITKRIFQELYLGSELFVEHYGMAPIFHEGDGYITRERMIPSKAQLDRLCTSHVMSIATGRPGSEALYALSHFNIKHYFTSMVSEDDVVKAEEGCAESLRKPHPFSLDLCMKRCGYTQDDTVYYIGDMPDDMMASRAAKAHAIGFVNGDSGESEELRKEHMVLLEQHGAYTVCSDFDEIISYLNLK